MQEIINVNLNDNHEPVVSGRQLHEALGVKTAYKDWFPRMTEYGFVEGQDFCSNLSESTGGRRAVDHIIKLDMAKEIAMIQRTDKGKQVRQYFIQVEKDFRAKALENTDESIAKRLRAEAMDRNSRTRQAQLISKFADAEIGQKLGISANKVGKLANANNLKIDRYGLTVLSKSKYSTKQVSTFVYYEEVVPVLRKILEVNK